MLPLKEESNWTLSADGLEYTVTVTGQDEFEGSQVFVLATQIAGFPFEYYLSKGPDGDFYHGAVSSTSSGIQTITYTPPRLQLPDELDYGGSETRDTAIRNEVNGFPIGGAFPITDTITLVGPELVTVPAGTFAAYKVVIDTVFVAAPITSIPSMSTNWYVPGIGLVKAVNVSDEGTETTVLLDYSLSGVDSDGDGLPDEYDPFPNDPSETADTDGDGTGNNGDPDDDNDGISDELELDCGINPLLPDADVDSDDDGLGNEEECLDGSDPLDPTDPGRSGLNLILFYDAICEQSGNC